MMAEDARTHTYLNDAIKKVLLPSYVPYEIICYSSQVFDVADWEGMV